MKLPILKLRKDQERRILAGHLWIYSNEIDTRATPLTGFEAGAPVRIVETVADVNDRRKRAMAQRIVEACGDSVNGAKIR